MRRTTVLLELIGAGTEPLRVPMHTAQTEYTEKNSPVVILYIVLYYTKYICIYIYLLLHFYYDDDCEATCNNDQATRRYNEYYTA